MPDLEQQQYASMTEDDATETRSDREAKNKILQSLVFAAIDDRETAIPEAFEKTYKWIFEENHDENNNSSVPPCKFYNFSEWLRRDTGEIYWITGKPGSGKSTLMKYIVSHGQTHENLRLWSTSKPLVMASFYFWNAGLEMQKTCDGLVRTLLFQCLKAQPDLIPHVCRKSWTLTKLFGCDMTLPQWTWKELENSLVLLAQQHGREAQFAIFVDGLDEFQGDERGHLKPVHLLKTVVGSSRLKLCVSSRPWTVFQDAFRTSPSLRLDILTKDDIMAYVCAKFDESPRLPRTSGCICG